MMRRILTGWAGLSLLTGTAAAGQGTPVNNPHGSITLACAVCHNADAWVPAHVSAGFDHAKVSTYRLEGAHTTVACRSCHADLTFRAAPTQCASCHQDPHHGAFGTTCGRCHSMRSFIDRSAMTRAHQLTRFPLTGAHLAADCESCHQPTAGEMLFTMRVSTCNECHARNYQATSNPNHAAVGFTRDCAQCHVAVSWQVAQFDHGGTAFPLTGAHRTAPCVDCHVSSGTRPSALCVSCHQSDYNGAADPSHTQSQFPTDCVVCHTTTAWQPASYRNHDAQFFRIYSGAHAGRWGSCATCHVNPGNYTQFDCLSCHRASGTNQDHSGVSGYTYDSPSCYRCHRSS